MLPILFHIPREVGGLPLFGYGLLVAVWAVFGVGMMFYVVRRQGWMADTWGYLPVLLIVTAVFIWVLPAICDSQGLPIRGYGVMTLLAVLAGMALGAYRARRVGISADTLVSLAFWVVLPGIVGARLFYVVEYWSTSYLPVFEQAGLKDLLISVVNLSEGGQVVYGGFFGAMIGLIGFLRSNRLPLLAVLDLIAPSLILGVAIGRIGCLMTGCCFGGVCAHGPAISFPPGSPAYINQMLRGQFYGFALSGDPKVAPVILAVEEDSPAAKAGLKVGNRLVRLGGEDIRIAGRAHRILEGHFVERRPLTVQAEGRSAASLPAVEIPRRSLPVHPTQIYSSIGALLICLLLLAYDPLRRRDGELFALMVGVYAVARFFMEMLRTDEVPIFGTGMSISQNISLLLLVCMAGFWYYLLRRPPGLAMVKKAER